MIGTNCPQCPSLSRTARRLLELTVAGFLGPWRVLRREHELIGLLVRRDLLTRTSGTLFGWGWTLAQPALQVLAFWFLFEFVLRVKVPGKVAFVDYFLTAIIPWLFLTETLLKSLSVMDEYSAVYRRTVFPLRVLPLLPALVTGALYLPIYVLLVAVLEGFPAIGKAVLIFIVLWVGVMPAAYLLAISGSFVKDLRQVFPFLLNLVFFVTPIIYLPEMLPAEIRPLLVLNPFADLIAAIHGLLYNTPVTLGNVLRPVLWWMLLLAPSWMLFHRAEPHLRELL